MLSPTAHLEGLLYEDLNNVFLIALWHSCARRKTFWTQFQCPINDLDMWTRSVFVQTTRCTQGLDVNTWKLVGRMKFGIAIVWDQSQCQNLELYGGRAGSTSTN